MAAMTPMSRIGRTAFNNSTSVFEPTISAANVMPTTQISSVSGRRSAPTSASSQRLSVSSARR